MTINLIEHKEEWKYNKKEERYETNLVGKITTEIDVKIKIERNNKNGYSWYLEDEYGEDQGSGDAADLKTAKKDAIKEFYSLYGE